MAKKKKTSVATRKQFFDVPPLRYTGSKWQVAEWIIEQFPQHDVYVEPYCGSGAVFFRKHRSPIEVLNDKDGDIVNFFEVLRTQPEELIRLIELTPYARVEYELSLQPCTDPVERARRFYTASWQSFGGTLVNKSGWRHQRNAKQRSPVVDTWRRMDGLLDAAWRLKDAQVENMDALECIRHYDGSATLFYVDPPYVMHSRSDRGKRRYRHEMNDDDHRQLAAALRQVQGMVLLSGYRSALYDELYGDWLAVDKSSTTNGQSSSIETLWLSPTAVEGRAPLFSGPHLQEAAL